MPAAVRVSLTSADSVIVDDIKVPSRLSVPTAPSTSVASHRFSVVKSTKFGIKQERHIELDTQHCAIRFIDTR